MPEGDSVAGHARKLGALLGTDRLVAIDGTAPSVRKNASRLLQGTFDSVRTHGKNLVVDFDHGWSILVHLGMTGRWRFLPSSRPAPGAARLVLSTETRHAACLGAPTVEVARTPAVERQLQALGPDLLHPDFNTTDFVERARRVPEHAIGELLLNQKVVAGIGNVYKSELLYMFRLHPETPSRLVPDETLVDLASRATRLLKANIGPRPRSTTGDHAPGRTTWVYGRAGKPCRRCATPIRSETIGDRVTYWCPSCQPEV